MVVLAIASVGWHAPKIVVVVAAAAAGAFMVILAIQSIGACGHGGSRSSKY